jgi:hypothetical protein
LTDRTPNASMVPGLLSQNLPNGINFNNYDGYYLHNFNGGVVQCAGHGLNIAKGSFRYVDHGLTKELLLDFDFNTSQHLYVEYITDGFEPCGETVLNPYFCNFFKCAMEKHWEEEKSPTRTEASIRRKSQDLWDAQRVVRARKNNLDPQTVLNISRRETRFSPKI